MMLGTTTRSVTARVHAVGESVLLSLRLTVVWVLLTLAGGVVAGVAPATVTAASLVRRAALGDDGSFWSTAWATWRRELVPSQRVVLPVAVAVTVLGSNYVAFTALGRAATVPRLATLAAFVLTGAVAAWLPGLYVHYELPWYRYVPTALRLAIGRPASTVLLLFVALGFGVACSAVPALAVVGIGAWWYASTWLCLRFFAENEERLEDERRGHRAETPVLPTEPLRIH
jgi:uncharacterized membrane protein YesL